MNSSRSSRLICLIVDDLEENLLALAELVRRDDIDVVKARSGRQALEALLQHDVALALVDVQMPEMDGFELAELMRGNERTRGVPIIFITAGARDMARQFKGYEAGAVDFLYKPVEPAVLKSKIDVFFALSRQRQELDRQLAERTEALRLHEMFTAVLGHDLRSPLSAIMMGAEVIRRRATDPALVKGAEHIATSSKWMARLIDDLLDMARARLAGGIRLVRVFTDLAKAIDPALADLRARFPDTAIEVVAQGDIAGEWDVDRLAQVASNLVGNAIQHGDKGSRIGVELDGREPDVVRIVVENRGGIPADLLEHVFDPFQGGAMDGGRKGGLGLGLYIVQEIAKAHGGSVAVDCAGGTTCFVVTLPRGRAPRAGLASATGAGLGSTTGADPVGATAHEVHTR